MLYRKILSLGIDYVLLILCTIIVVNYIVPIPVGIWAGIKEHGGAVVSSGEIKRMIGNLSLWFMLMVSFCYYSHFMKKSGQTIGEKVMKIKIVPFRGEKISLLAGVVRFFFLAPLLAIIGFISVSRNPYKSLLDHICGTETVKVEE